MKFTTYSLRAIRRRLLAVDSPQGLHFRLRQVSPVQHCWVRAQAAPRRRQTLQRLGLPRGASQTLFPGVQHCDLLVHTWFSNLHGGGLV